MSEKTKKSCVMKICLVALVLAAPAACQRWKKDLAFSEKEKNSPEYTVEFDANTSPRDKK